MKKVWNIKKEQDVDEGFDLNTVYDDMTDKWGAAKGDYKITVLVEKKLKRNKNKHEKKKNKEAS